jgi:penicillin V acylase-like amidase (Ntn superfamily)
MHRVVFVLVLILATQTAHPCTTFCMARDGETLFGRNYDFEIGQAFVMTNHRGVNKTSVAGTLHWTTKYASVTFNQWGREFPMDGMNEAGLVIGLMWLDGTKYPVDERPALRVLEWIQYNLDNAASVDDVLRNLEKTRIAGSTPLHYLVADATGDTATIEFLDGRLVAHRGASLPAPVLANDTYTRSLQHLALFEGRRTVPAGAGSLDRFARAAMEVRDGKASVDRAFDILASVSQGAWTRWSVVYDAKRREVSWVSDDSTARKTIRLAALDLRCAATARMLNVDAPAGGDVTSRLEPYSAARNRELVLSSYAGTSFTRTVPVSYAEQEAAHAEKGTCDGGRRRAVRASAAR